MIGATFRDFWVFFSPGLVVDAPADDADLVVDLRVVVGLGVDAAVVAFELVGHLQTAAWRQNEVSISKPVNFSDMRKTVIIESLLGFQT